MKDAKGHGSNTGTKGMRLVKTHVLGPHSAKVYNNPEWGEKVVKFFHNGVYQSKADSHTDDIGDAHATAQHQLQRYADQDAKASLASGPKSAPAPVHDSMQTPGHSTDPHAFDNDYPSHPMYKLANRQLDTTRGVRPETRERTGADLLAKYRKD